MEWGASDLHSEMAMVPRNMNFQGEAAPGVGGITWKNTYGYVSIDAAGLPYATDGMNEAGLTVGALFYPGFAEYQPPDDSKRAATLSNVELVNYLLGNFATVAEVRAAVPGLHVVRNERVEAEFGTPLPLHHVVTDPTGASIVIEYTKGTLAIFDNDVGVMTNSPSYDWHLLNLRNYPNLTPMGASRDRAINGVSLAPFGAGSGMLGLPGDFTPPSRFIRAVAFVHTMEPVADATAAVDAASTMLNNFDIPKGLVRDGSTDDYTLGYTQWSSIADTRNKVYYYWTMYDRSLRSVDLKTLDFSGSARTSFPLDAPRAQSIEDKSGAFAN
ncbi:MAG: linear amide C-N hydrolase, partial [Rhodobacterales bacterium]|nr:linear amide C-N hydrolase [Rhodobacterales bacterium]